MEPPSEPPSIAETTEDDDNLLANSEFLTRQELVKRRLRRTKRLIEFYRDYYWSLMEELKRKHREYYWIYGKSPYKDDDVVVVDDLVTENGVDNNKLGFENSTSNRCGFHGCKSKAMALSTHCHPHILSDQKQKLYKACKFCFKSTGAGPILCGKPILVSTIPSLCSVHIQRAEKNLRGILKKEGAPVALSSRLASKFHLVIAEYVQLIQSRRRAAAAAAAAASLNNIDDLAVKDELI